MQSVLVDTKRDVEGLKRKIDRLLAEDADHRAIVSSRHCASPGSRQRREIAQREEECRWIRESIEEVAKTTREGEADRMFGHYVLIRSPSTCHIARPSIGGADKLARTGSRACGADAWPRLRTDQQSGFDRVRGAVVHLIRADVQLGAISSGQSHQSLPNEPCSDTRRRLPYCPAASTHPALLHTGCSTSDPGRSEGSRPTVVTSAWRDARRRRQGRREDHGSGIGIRRDGCANFGQPRRSGRRCAVSRHLRGQPESCQGRRERYARASVVSWCTDRLSQLNIRFPLYAKGVERYRYEYAVFLLNKNIETVRVHSVAPEKRADSS